MFVLCTVAYSHSPIDDSSEMQGNAVLHIRLVVDDRHVMPNALD